MKDIATNHLYWACQIAGWGAYSIIGLAIITGFTGWHNSIAAGFGLFFVYSIALTHMLRGLIYRLDWLMLPAGRGLPRIFASAIGAGLVQTSLVVSFSRLLTGSDAFDTAGILSTAGGVACATCIWAALYVGISWNRRYRQAQFREVQLQLTLRQAELRALQAQVNPHFLFNCLNTIRGMVAEDPGRAQNMITSLASLLRRSLQTPGAQMVSLAEEMDAVADYLALEATRFEERLQVSLQIDDEARTCAVPAMLVQTLVENAVKHGISRLPRGGSIRVRGIGQSESVIVQVENTGSLMAPDRKGRHTGLDNARERLRLFYGERATLELSGMDGKVTATVVLPKNL